MDQTGESRSASNQGRQNNIPVQHHHHQTNPDPERSYPPVDGVVAEESSAQHSYGTIIIRHESVPPQASTMTKVKNICLFALVLCLMVISFAICALMTLWLFKHLHVK